MTPRLPPSVVTRAAALGKTTEDDDDHSVQKDKGSSDISDQGNKRKNNNNNNNDTHNEEDDDSDIIFKADGYGSTVISAVFNHDHNNNHNNNNNINNNNNNRNNSHRRHISLSFDSPSTSDTSSTTTSDDDGHRHHLHLRHPFPHRHHHHHKTITRSVSPSSPEKPSALDLITAAEDDPDTTRTPSSLGSDKQDHVFIDTTDVQAYLPPPHLTQPQQEQLKAKCKPFVMHPPSSTPEPFRDVRGPVTLYRIILVLWTLAVVGSLFKLQDWIWPPDPYGSPYNDEWYARTSIGCILLVPLLSCMLAFIGAFWFRFDESLDSVRPMRHKVVFRIVSRGINNACLLETIRACQTVMRRNSYFPYLVEIVTDAGVFEAPDDPDVIHLKVPLEYKTRNRTMFKARALHYACEMSVVPNNAWIVHLDEETQPTSSSIKGLCKFISKCEREKDRRRIGQGCILYHRSWKSYRFLTLADMRRTGDDFGHFFLQHRLGIILFGLHGAFVVCRVDTEKRIGFDVGPHGSITEDAWWSLMALEKGCRFAWVDGFLGEQSTQSISDLIKQRRRWNYGLMKVAFMSPTRLRYRFSFAFFLVMWFISPFVTPFQVLYVVVIIWHDLPIPMMVRIPTLFIISTQVWTYFIGWVINVREGLDVKWFMVPIWTVVLIVLYPVFQVFEIVALFMSFFAGLSKSGRGFHVVQKTALTTEKQTAEEKGLLV